MPVNELLIRQTVAAIEADQVHWDQEAFISAEGTKRDENPLSCGTTMCFAGWATRLHKGDEAFLAENFRWDSGRGWQERIWGGHDVESEAANALGLDDWDAHRIFFCFTNDVEVLKARITEVTGITFDQEPTDG